MLGRLMLKVILHLKYKHITITGIKSRILLKEKNSISIERRSTNYLYEQTHALFTQKLKIFNKLILKNVNSKLYNNLEILHIC